MQFSSFGRLGVRVGAEPLGPSLEAPTGALSGADNQQQETRPVDGHLASRTPSEAVMEEAFLAEEEAVWPLIEATPDVPDVPDVPDDAVVVVEHPDGSADVGIDCTKLPKTPRRRRGRNSQLLEARMEEEVSSAFNALRLQQAEHYRTHDLRIRRIIFTVFMVLDCGFFLAALLYQLFTGGLGRMRRKGLSLGSKKPVQWWLNPKSLTLEEISLSLIIDLIGFVSGLQDKTYLIGLFMMLQAIATVLVSLRGFSLLLLFRVAQLVAAGLLRSAVFHYMRMVLSDQDRAQLENMFIGVCTYLATITGFCGVLCGREAAVSRRPTGGPGSAGDPSGSVTSGRGAATARSAAAAAAPAAAGGGPSATVVGTTGGPAAAAGLLEQGGQWNGGGLMVGQSQPQSRPPQYMQQGGIGATTGDGMMPDTVPATATATAGMGTDESSAWQQQQQLQHPAATGAPRALAGAAGTAAMSPVPSAAGSAGRSSAFHWPALLHNPLARFSRQSSTNRRSPSQRGGRDVGGSGGGAGGGGRSAATVAPAPPPLAEAALAPPPQLTVQQLRRLRQQLQLTYIQRQLRVYELQRQLQGQLAAQQGAQQGLGQTQGQGLAQRSQAQVQMAAQQGWGQAQAHGHTAQAGPPGHDQALSTAAPAVGSLAAAMTAATRQLQHQHQDEPGTAPAAAPAASPNALQPAADPAGVPPAALREGTGGGAAAEEAADAATTTAWEAFPARTAPVAMDPGGTLAVLRGQVPQEGVRGAGSAALLFTPQQATPHASAMDAAAAGSQWAVAPAPAAAPQTFGAGGMGGGLLAGVGGGVGDGGSGSGGDWGESRGRDAGNSPAERRETRVPAKPRPAGSVKWWRPAEPLWRSLRGSGGAQEHRSAPKLPTAPVMATAGAEKPTRLVSPSAAAPAEMPVPFMEIRHAAAPSPPLVSDVRLDPGGPRQSAVLQDPSPPPEALSSSSYYNRATAAAATNAPSEGAEALSLSVRNNPVYSSTLYTGGGGANDLAAAAARSAHTRPSSSSAVPVTAVPERTDLMLPTGLESAMVAISASAGTTSSAGRQGRTTAPAMIGGAHTGGGTDGLYPAAAVAALPVDSSVAAAVGPASCCEGITAAAVAAAAGAETSPPPLQAGAVGSHLGPQRTPSERRAAGEPAPEEDARVASDAVIGGGAAGRHGLQEQPAREQQRQQQQQREVLERLQQQLAQLQERCAAGGGGGGGRVLQAGKAVPRDTGPVEGAGDGADRPSPLGAAVQAAFEEAQRLQRLALERRGQALPSYPQPHTHPHPLPLPHPHHQHQQQHQHAQTMLHSWSSGPGGDRGRDAGWGGSGSPGPTTEEAVDPGVLAAARAAAVPFSRSSKSTRSASASPAVSGGSAAASNADSSATSGEAAQAPAAPQHQGEPQPQPQPRPLGALQPAQEVQHHSQQAGTEQRPAEGEGVGMGVAGIGLEGRRQHHEAAYTTAAAGPGPTGVVVGGSGSNSPGAPAPWTLESMLDRSAPVPDEVLPTRPSAPAPFQREHATTLPEPTALPSHEAHQGGRPPRVVAAIAATNGDNCGVGLVQPQPTTHVAFASGAGNGSAGAVAVASGAAGAGPRMGRTGSGGSQASSKPGGQARGRMASPLHLSSHPLAWLTDDGAAGSAASTVLEEEEEVDVEEKGVVGSQTERRQGASGGAAQPGSHRASAGRVTEPAAAARGPGRPAPPTATAAAAAAGAGVQRGLPYRGEPGSRGASHQSLSNPHPQPHASKPAQVHPNAGPQLSRQPGSASARATEEELRQRQQRLQLLRLQLMERQASLLRRGGEAAGPSQTAGQISSGGERAGVGGSRRGPSAVMGMGSMRMGSGGRSGGPRAG